jgi:hypothetical protein
MANMVQYKRLLYHTAFVLAAALFLAACPLEDDPLGGGEGLDPRLYGVWRFEYDRIVEEIRVTPEPLNPGNLRAFTSGTDVWEALGFQESFAGDIRYAKSFKDDAGIIIIEYWPGHKQLWVDWDKATPPFYFPPRDDNPVGNFYGIYYLNMNEEGTQVFLANTSDQGNNYGPTETETLEEAIAKFTEGNMNQMLDLSIGDPQHKVEDY